MNESKISVRYARALFMLAVEKNKLDDIKLDVELIYKTSLIPDFNLFLNSPITKESEKKAFLKAVFSSKIGNESLQFLYLLIQNKREKYITDSTRNFLTIYRKHVGIMNVELITAGAISVEHRSKIITMVKEKTKSLVELTEKTDASILGGFILRIEDQQYDASIANKVKQFKNSLLNTSVQA